MNIEPRPRTALTGLWRARKEFIATRGVSHALSVSYNQPSSLSRVRFDLRRLHARMDRLLLGRRFNQLPAACRTWFAGAIENLGSNAHVHLAVRPPMGRQDDMEALFRTSPNPWQMLAPHASHHLRRIHDEAGWAGYILKEMAASAEWVISDEFLPAAILAE